MIIENGALKENTHVTLPSEINPKSGHKQIEKQLEIGSGKGSNYIDVQVPESNLKIPANGHTTSGGAWQRQITKPTPINPDNFKRPPCRPTN